MGGSPCSSSVEVLKRGAWTAEEDMILSHYIGIHGDGAWTNLPQKAGLKRSAKSCRLRWLNYLRPDIDHGNISPDEEELIIRMHRLLGNRWSLIAKRLPGRTDNKIKNHWNTHLSKKVQLSVSKCNAQILKREPTFPSPVQNHMFKPRPMKIVRPNMWKGHGSNHSSDEGSFKFGNLQETNNSSQPAWCDLPVENSLDVNIAGKEVTNSTLTDQNSENVAHSLMFVKEVSSPDYNLLSSPSYCQLSTDFGLKELYMAPVTLATETNGFEGMCPFRSNLEPINSFTFAEDLGNEELYSGSL
eukprot:PITA_17510